MLLKEMSREALSKHMTDRLRIIETLETEDTLGTMLVIFTDEGVCQYGATKQLTEVPQMLRELADRYEERENGDVLPQDTDAG